MDETVFEVSGALVAWRPADASGAGWHFLPVTGRQAAEIRYQSLGQASGFGSVRVKVLVGKTEWTTSLFPDRSSGGYLLPVKAEVRRRERLFAGDEVRARLTLLGG